MGLLLRGFRWPRFLAAVAAAALVLGIAAATGPLFLASAANAMLDDELGLIGRADAGLTVRLYGVIQSDQFEDAQKELYDAIRPIDRLGAPTATAIGASLSVKRPGGDVEARMRLLYRDRALDNVQPIAGEPGADGIWINDGVAAVIDVDVGDEIVIIRGGSRELEKVAGIYRSLSAAPLSDYWRPLTFDIINPRSNDLSPPPFLIADKETFFDIGGDVVEEAELIWHFPLADADMTYDDALVLERRYQEAHRAPDDPLSPLGAAVRELQVYAFDPVSIDSLMFSVMDRIRATVTSLDASIRVITWAGEAVALFAIGGAGVFIARGRRTEVRLLLAQGISPVGIAARFAFENLVPIVGGVALGLAGAGILISWLGPGDPLTSSSVQEALRSGAIGSIIGAAIFGLLVAAQARKEVDIGFARVRRVLGRTPWEIIVLALAGAAYYEIASGRSAVIAGPQEAPEIDIFVLMFPLLFISGVAGIGMRLLKRLLPRLRTSGAGLPLPLYLAWRRLADASGTALMLMSMTVVASGVLIYSATLVESLEATVEAKAQVATGSDVAIAVTQQAEEPDAPFPTTKITRGRTELFPGDVAVDVIGIDPATFASTAYWDDSFSEKSLDDLIEMLGGEDRRLPVIVSGVEARGQLSMNVSEREIPVQVIDNPTAFPGMMFNTPVVVVDLSNFARHVEAAGGSTAVLSVASSPEIWGKGDPAEVLEYFREQGLAVGAVRDSREFLETGPLQSVTWTFSLMQALGILAAVVVVIALLFYLETRQREREAAYGLTRRMGLGRSTHRASLAVELFVLLGVAVLLGEITSVLAGKLALAHADPLPEQAPPALFRVPLAVVAGLAPILLAIAAVGAWRVQRAADRVRMAEVMRVAG